VRTLTAQAPDRTQWQVRVAWLPRWRFLARRFGGWRRRRKGRDSGGLDLPDLNVGGGSGGGNHAGGGGGGHSGGGGGGGGFFDSLADEVAVILIILIAFVAAALLFWFLLLPLLLLVVDLLAVVVLCVLAALARVLFRRPWQVEAESGTRTFVLDVVGWRAALRTRDEIAERLRSGYPPGSIVHSGAGRWRAVGS